MLQPYDLLLVRRQLVERAAYLPDAVQRLGRLWLRGQRGIGRRDRVERVRPPASLAALEVDGCPPGDRRQPRRHLTLLVERGGGAPGVEKRLLGRLFGEG